jgi:hypothetical protein
MTIYKMTATKGKTVVTMNFEAASWARSFARTYEADGYNIQITTLNA